MFFFFQAEDGIRDGHVTGVQTCALPISTRGESESAMRCRRSNLPTEDAAPVAGAQPAARPTFRVPGRGTHPRSVARHEPTGVPSASADPDLLTGLLDVLAVTAVTRAGQAVELRA